MRLHLFLLATAATTLAVAETKSLRFDFGIDGPREGFTQISSFAESDAIQFLYNDDCRISNEALEVDGNLVLSLPLEEGNYDVVFHFKPAESRETPITLKSESRRLMLLNAPQDTNRDFEYTITVNTRTDNLENGGSVALKDREVGTWTWNDALEIEVASEHCSLDYIEIRPNPEARTLYLIGDSTVADQTSEPWIGWGQVLPVFLQPGVAVSNHSASGFAFSSFKSMKRFDKVLEDLAPGDLVLIQFGHNDQKEKGEGIGAWESYTDYIHEFTGAVRAEGAKPILISSMKRRRFDEAGRQFETLGDYPRAVRQAAANLNVPLIDLNFMSGVFYGALGPEDSKKAFVHYPANTFANQPRALADDTHFNIYGGHQLARCIVEQLKFIAPELSPYWIRDLGHYDPSMPDEVESINVPVSPIASSIKPDGS